MIKRNQKIAKNQNNAHPSISDKDGKDILDPETLTHLKDEHGFYDSAKMDGWHISIQKRLLERIETLEKQLQVLAESENKHD